MTLTELAKRSGRSVTEIAMYALGGNAVSRAATSKNGATAKAKTTKPGRRAAVASVRSRSGREDFDNRVLDAVRSLGGRAQSVDVERLVGGTPQQRRAALKRLVATKKLTRSGNARATTYALR